MAYLFENRWPIFSRASTGCSSSEALLRTGDFVADVRTYCRSLGLNGTDVLMTDDELNAFRTNLAAIARGDIQAAGALPKMEKYDDRTFRRYFAVISAELYRRDMALVYLKTSYDHQKSEVAVLLIRLTPDKTVRTTEKFRSFSEDAAKVTVAVRYADSFEYLASGVDKLAAGVGMLDGTVIELPNELGVVLINRAAIAETVKQYALEGRVATAAEVESATLENETGHVVFQALLPERVRDLNFQMQMFGTLIAGYQMSEAFSDMSSLEFGAAPLRTLEEVLTAEFDNYLLSRILATTGLKEALRKNPDLLRKIGGRMNAGQPEYETSTLCRYLASDPEAARAVIAEVLVVYREVLRGVITSANRS